MNTITSMDSGTPVRLEAEGSSALARQGRIAAGLTSAKHRQRSQSGNTAG
jgi:hypothetical protein